MFSKFSSDILLCLFPGHSVLEAGYFYGYRPNIRVSRRILRRLPAPSGLGVIFRYGRFFREGRRGMHSGGCPLRHGAKQIPPSGTGACAWQQEREFGQPGRNRQTKRGRGGRGTCGPPNPVIPPGGCPLRSAVSSDKPAFVVRARPLPPASPILPSGLTAACPQPKLPVHAGVRDVVVTRCYTCKKPTPPRKHRLKNQWPIRSRQSPENGPRSSGQT